MKEPITDGISRRDDEHDGSTQTTPPPGYSFPTHKLAKTLQGQLRSRDPRRPGRRW
ncbi:hypothetical protein H4R21_002918 [Coemansia helicoidea]|uniref:Uncharacterized protein n=1 Tax=Coemansia helicoidea TaxID=1286919 RepID=A0ACC1L567_9FUNG|nr:hypothetical protein H4R21_002918 [Coemansia helicoidea]